MPERHKEKTYLNAILVVRTRLDVETWSRKLHSIEDALHRVRTGEANIPRPIDVDLLTYGDVQMARPDLTLPHPRALERRFVLQPLAELVPELVFPGATDSVAESLAKLPETPWVRRFADFPKGPRHRPLPFLTAFDLQKELDSGATLLRIPPGVHVLKQPLLLRSHLRLVAAAGARIVVSEVLGMGAPTLQEISISGGTWKGSFRFHGVRGLRLSQLTIEGTIRVSRVDGFSMRHVRVEAPAGEMDAMVLGASTRHGSVADVRGHAERALVALETEKAFGKAHVYDVSSGPISHIELRGVVAESCAPVVLHRERGSLFALQPRVLNQEALRLWQPARRRAKELVLPRSFARVFRPTGWVYVTSPFGVRIHPVTGERSSFHAGVDCVMRSGKRLLETGICAAADGVVREAADSEGPAGTVVVLDHGRGEVTRYFHLEVGSLRVRAGEKVRRGTLLGWMGTTGRSTGEHLHFQKEQNDGIVCPVKVLPLARSHV